MLVSIAGPLLWVGLAASPPDLQRAEELVAQFKYAEARTALARARGAKELDRRSLLRILELQGIAAGQLRQSAAAEAAFRELLVLDPAHKLDADYAPRVGTPFLEAGGWVGANGALEVKGGVAQANGQVAALVVDVVKDPLKQARQVRFHLLGEAARVETVALDKGSARLEVVAAEVSWWAEVLGANDAQLVLVGAEAQPRVERGDAPVAAGSPAAVSAPAARPKAPEAPPLLVSTAGPAPLRTSSYFVLGGALVAGGAGAVFGVQSSRAFGQVEHATRDANGRITGLTEKQAYALNASGAESATIANALFITAGVLGASGVVMWVLGAPVAVSAGPGGVAVSGRFP